MPFVEMLKTETDKQKGRPLSVEEIGKLYAEWADHMRLFMILMLGTGARNEAISTLTWDQIDFENNNQADLDALSNQNHRECASSVPVVWKKIA